MFGISHFCLGTKVPRHSAGIIGRYVRGGMPLVARAHSTRVNYCHAHKKYKKEILAHSQRAIAKDYEQEHEQRENRLQLRRSRRLQARERESSKQREQTRREREHQESSKQREIRLQTRRDRQRQRRQQENSERAETTTLGHA